VTTFLRLVLTVDEDDDDESLSLFERSLREGDDIEVEARSPLLDLREVDERRLSVGSTPIADNVLLLATAVVDEESLSLSFLLSGVSILGLLLSLLRGVFKSDVVAKAGDNKSSSLTLELFGRDPESEDEVAAALGVEVDNRFEDDEDVLRSPEGEITFDPLPPPPPLLPLSDAVE